MKKPSKGFFEVKEIDETALKNKAGRNELILIDIIPKKGKDDVIGCKLIKALEFIKKKLENNDFSILNSGWHWNKNALFYLVIKKEKLPDLVEREGPPLKTKEHVQNFKNKYKNTFIKKGRICAKIKREFKTPKELINSLKKEDYLKEKINNMKLR